MNFDRTFRRLPLIAAIIACITAAPLAYNVRNIAVFLITLIYYIPILFVLCIGLMTWGIIQKRRRWSLLLSGAIVIVVPLGMLMGENFIHDYLAFWAWYPTHHRLIDDYRARDGIVMTWDSWGFAGGGNDSYLVSNPSDSISNTEAATLWTYRLEHACEVVDVKRMIRGVYILTTYNCPLQ